MLLVSDGFLALASDYGRYDAEELVEAASDKGLRALYNELREIEATDPEGPPLSALQEKRRRDGGVAEDRLNVCLVGDPRAATCPDPVKAIKTAPVRTVMSGSVISAERPGR